MQSCDHSEKRHHTLLTNVNAGRAAELDQLPDENEDHSYPQFQTLPPSCIEIPPLQAIKWLVAESPTLLVR